MLLPFGHPVLQAEEPKKVPKEDAEVVAAVRKAAVNAEIHGIGIGQPVEQGFGWEDVKNWPRFVELLRKREGPAGRIWALLPKERQDVVSDDTVVSQLGGRDPLPAPVRGLRSDTAHEISKMLKRPDFYEEKAFKDVPLDKSLNDMLALGQKRTYIQTLRMNRELLATAFPNVVSPVPANYHIVRVLVKAGKPVVLVLTAYTACQWQVEVEEGGAVVGIVLGGGEAQEVASIKVPVVYRAGVDEYFKHRKGDVIWTSRDRNDKSFIQLEDRVKKITGKTFADFQGKSETPKEGFVAKPSAK
jgi:hypothetical protein